jgi:hydrogenase maturation protein HypF
MTPSDLDVPVRRRIRLRGVVQGVGFRPFVHRLATELGVSGLVGNDAEGVFVEVEGDRGAVATFEGRLVADKPVLARIDDVDAVTIDPVGERTFRIVESRPGVAVQTFVPPDIAVCDACLRELFDPFDRRYRYPFINCTNCGPRFTITVRLPYDRPNTTMRDFPLCDACAAEYHDPADRRFHAQPVACAACGPRLWFEDANGTIGGTDAALAAAQRALDEGGIVAVKGLGGYHLACDARSHEAVALLRRRKSRPDKPLAVMVPDLAAARRLGSIDGAEAARLTSAQRPIVLVSRRDDAGLSSLVAPGSPFVGVLLPYSPLHHLLFRPVPDSDAVAPDALVMTSGNLSDEPICYDDKDVRDRLGAIADAWLIHDRPIHVPCDDSVVRVVDGDDLPIRRSRGYAPLTIRLPFASAPTLAVGGELKNTFCLASGNHAWMSQHIGDMGSVETLAAFEGSTRQFAEMYDVGATSLVADAHPGYHTRSWGEGRGGEALVLAQHHHAHIAAVMAEHALRSNEEVIGFAFDGTGYGTEGAIWGGEVLVASYAGFERAGHLRYVPLPGGDTTIRKPYRAALSHLWAAGIEWTPDLAPARFATSDELVVLRRQLERGVHCVPTSSMGRLFDAVSSLLGVRHLVSYEAQAAIEMETVASTHLGAARDYRFASVCTESVPIRCTRDEIDPAPVLRSIVDDIRNGYPTGAIAAGFHIAVARLVADCAEQLRDDTGIGQVALSGGVFQNVLLVRLTRAHLEARGFEVLTHRLVPPNDGGLALGQVAIAAHRGTTSRRDR